jgi:hypothetical protein
MTMTTKRNNLYIYDGDTFEHKGHTYKVEYAIDQDHGEPWKNADGHGIVSEWTGRNKGAGEWILVADNGRKRYYDFAETLKIARKDGWGVEGGKLPGESNREYAVRAVTADYEFLRAWCNDDWRYVGVIVTEVLEDEDGDAIEGGESESLWGVETYKDYHMEVAMELADEIHARLEVANPDVQLSVN